MKRQWNVIRNFKENVEAEARWDQVYQKLLSWSVEEKSCETQTREKNKQEKKHESSHIRKSINTTPSANTK